MDAESVELSGADEDDYTAAPTPVGVTPAGSDDQDVVDVKVHAVDAVITQSSPECVEGPRVS